MIHDVCARMQINVYPGTWFLLTCCWIIGLVVGSESSRTMISIKLIGKLIFRPGATWFLLAARHLVFLTWLGLLAKGNFPISFLTFQNKVRKLKRLTSSFSGWGLVRTHLNAGEWATLSGLGVSLAALWTFDFYAKGSGTMLALMILNAIYFEWLLKNATKMAAHCSDTRKRWLRLLLQQQAISSVSTLGSSRGRSPLNRIDSASSATSTLGNMTVHNQSNDTLVSFSDSVKSDPREQLGVIYKKQRDLMVSIWTVLLCGACGTASVLIMRLFFHQPMYALLISTMTWEAGQFMVVIRLT